MASLTVVPRKRRRRTTPASQEWLSPKEAAAHVGVSVATIYDACARRGLRHVKLGHSTIRLRPEWLEEWMQRQVIAPD